jgi:hypothetical protein
MRRTAVLAIAAVIGSLSPDTVGADLNINVNIGPPPIVLASPPKLVVIPESPVKWAPGVEVNLFFYGGRYYSFHEGRWFQAASHGGPWVVIAIGKVPPPVLAVPVTYYKVPPGHAKKTGGGHPGSGSPGPAKGCPPGLAKQGRC